MTGEEFLNKVRGIKEITDIQWHQTGDYFDPDVVKIAVVADGECIDVSFPRTTEHEAYIFHQNVSLALLLNKFAEQRGIDFKINAHASFDSFVTAINHLIKQI